MASNKLNSRQHRFCLNILAGMSQTDAYLNAGYNTSRDIASSNASVLMALPKISQFFEPLRSKALAEVQASVLSKMEKRQILADIVRASLADHLDSTGDIKLNIAKAKVLKEFYKRTHTDRDGNQVVTKSIKLIDPIVAIQEDNKMMGDYAPSRHLVAQKVQFEIVHTEKKRGQSEPTALT